jgi:uncharacterized coiled-coil protein SlyX
MPESIIPPLKNGTAKIAGGTSLGVILLALASYVIANRDNLGIQGVRLNAVETQAVEQKQVNRELQHDIGQIKVNIEAMRGDLKHMNQSMDEIKHMVRR